eukprot:3136623-Rhodomonas_salina.1
MTLPIMWFSNSGASITLSVGSRYPITLSPPLPPHRTTLPFSLTLSHTHTPLFPPCSLLPAPCSLLEA